MRKSGAKLFHAGFACVDITPAEPLPMGGYIARSEPAAGAHDPLHAKAAAFRRDGATAILVALDILYVSTEWSRRVREAVSRKTGVPQENILIAATHTHSGPGVFTPILGHDEPIVRYEQRLLDCSVEAAEAALGSTEPASMRAACAVSEGIASNRRDRAAPTESPLSVVRIESLSGTVKGHLVSFACHPTVLAASNLRYSADLFGMAARAVERAFRRSTCIMFNGAAGDASTRFTRRKQTPDELERLGKKLGRQIVGASKCSEAVAAGPISAKIVLMRFPFRKIHSAERAQKQYDKALAKLRDAYARPDAGHEDHVLLRSLLDGAAAQLVLSRTGGWKHLFAANAAKVEVQAIRVGDLVVCGLPGEFFGARGTELKDAALPKFGLVVGYANGYWGYIVPPAESAKGGYEALMSPLHPRNEPKIIVEATALIREVGKLRRREKGIEHV